MRAQTRVLFLPADLGGNIPPTLAVAEALAHRGADVEIAGLDAERTAFPQPPFGPATAIRSQVGGKGPGRAGSMLRLMAGRRTVQTATALIAERRPDVVVVDCMILAPIRGALESGVPVVLLFHTFGAFWAHTFDRGPAGRLLGLFGMRPKKLWDGAAMRLLLTDADLDPARDDPALSGYEWTGTTELGVAPEAHGARPRLLVALSSTDWPGMLPVYRRIIEALSVLPVDAVVTTGGVDLGGELTGTANIEVRDWIDHEELLPSTDLMIGHGGHSTTMKVLAHGIPLLILPINPTSDQRLVGETVQAAQLGRCLARSASAQQIRESVRAILEDDELRDNAATAGRRLRSLPPGAEVAADRIFAVAHRA